MNARDDASDTVAQAGIAEHLNSIRGLAERSDVILRGRFQSKKPAACWSPAKISRRRKCEVSSRMIRPHNLASFMPSCIAGLERSNQKAELSVRSLKQFAIGLIGYCSK